MKKWLINLTLLCIGLAIGWWWPVKRDSLATAAADRPERQSVLGDLKFGSVWPKGEQLAAIPDEVFAASSLTTMSAIIRVAASLTDLDADRLMQVVNLTEEASNDRESMGSALLRVYAGALLADNHPEALFEALKNEQLSDEDEVLVNLLFKRWIPNELKSGNVDELPESYLVGLAEREPEQAWKLVLESAIVDDDVWRALARQWYGKDPGFLGEKLSELSDTYQRRALLGGWGTALAQQSPQRAIHLLDGLEVEDTERSAYLRNVVSVWAGKDFTAALNYLATVEGPVADRLIQASLPNLAAVNPLATADWTIKHLQGNPLDQSLTKLLPKLATSDLDGARVLHREIGSAELAERALSDMVEAVMETDPIAAYELHEAAGHSGGMPVKLADADARADLDYAYGVLLGKTSFREEQRWASALTVQLAGLPQETAQEWLKSVADDDWRRRLTWLTADKNDLF